MEPVFLSLDEVLEIHRDQIARHGGSEGVRDIGLLNSALAMPMATFGGQFLHVDLYEMAAAYLFHLAKNHPFLDGNKRVAAAAVNMFLFMNDVRFVPNEDEYTQLVLDIACGVKSKSAAAEFIRANCE